MKFEIMNKYFMYHYNCGKVSNIFSHFLNRNNDIQEHNTRIAYHFHIPAVKTDLGKTGINRGAVIWNIIVKDGINANVSETVFKKKLKSWKLMELFFKSLRPCYAIRGYSGCGLGQ